LSANVVSLDAINVERGLAGGQGIPVKEWPTTKDEARRRVGAEGRSRGGRRRRG
jgi:hypothetical protein